MKNTILNYSNLRNVKVGDTLYTIFGKENVKNIDTFSEYPINTGNNSYTLEGFVLTNLTIPSAFTENVFEMELKPKEYWAMVSDEPITDENKGLKRRVFMEKNGCYLAWDTAETDEEADIQTISNMWKHAVPITEAEPLTLEQRIERLEKINNLK